LQAVSERGTKSTSVATNFYQSNDFYQNQKWSEASRNVVEGGVVHQEDAELPAVRQEDFNGVVLGAQVEEAQEVDLEAGARPAALEVVAVVVVEEVGLAVEDVEVSEGRSSVACKNLFLYCNSFAVYLFSNLTRYGEAGKVILQFYNRLHLSTRYGFNDFTSAVTILTRFTRSCSRDIIWSNSVAAEEVSSNVCSIRFD